MRVLVCGARDYDDRSLLLTTLDELHIEHDFDIVIQGGARGADTYAAEWAQLHRIPILEFKANWEEYGRAAGPIRNRQMIREGHPNLVIAFPKTTLAQSRGTRNMVEQAKRAGITVFVVERHDNQIMMYTE